jgi:uncharacterized membrane protein
MVLTQIGWLHDGPSVAAAFLASLVEFVEALTVILAVGSVRGWRDATLGAGVAICALFAAVAILGTALVRLPLPLLQLGIGTLLLLFGLRWLRKAILRAGGVIPLRDEAAAFTRETARLRQAHPAAGWDRIAFGTAFQITLLEGTEVVFIVIAIGVHGGDMLAAAGLGAALALAAVILLGLAIHRPLARGPENTLKFTVGLLLSAFGTFWVGEGFGIAWPGDDAGILVLIAAYLGLALGTTALVRAQSKNRAIAGVR